MKELHSTLIRLLNELSPWEPKLVKAFQRNRYRRIYQSCPAKSEDFIQRIPMWFFLCSAGFV